MHSYCIYILLQIQETINVLILVTWELLSASWSYSLTLPNSLHIHPLSLPISFKIKPPKTKATAKIFLNECSSTGVWLSYQGLVLEQTVSTLS